MSVEGQIYRPAIRIGSGTASKNGYVLVRNPMNDRQVSRISLNPRAVDGFVFWTKNPLPMLRRLEELEEYPYYFQFTLTPYGRDLEPGLPSKRERLLRHL